MRRGTPHAKTREFGMQTIPRRYEEVSDAQFLAAYAHSSTVRAEQSRLMDEAKGLRTDLAKLERSYAAILKEIVGKQRLLRQLQEEYDRQKQLQARRRKKAEAELTGSRDLQDLPRQAQLKSLGTLADEVLDAVRTVHQALAHSAHTQDAERDALMREVLAESRLKNLFFRSRGPRKSQSAVIQMFFGVHESRKKRRATSRRGRSTRGA
jgi:Skp family chaperone for outer membrane proteins